MATNALDYSQEFASSLLQQQQKFIISMVSPWLEHFNNSSYPLKAGLLGLDAVAGLLGLAGAVAGLIRLGGA
jgi:hypothetical protein